MSYFETLSGAIDFARQEAVSKGFTPMEIDFWDLNHVHYSTTERRSIELIDAKGKLSKKCLQLVIYRMESGKYELVNYIN